MLGSRQKLQRSDKATARKKIHAAAIVLTNNLISLSLGIRFRYLLNKPNYYMILKFDIRLTVYI